MNRDEGARDEGPLPARRRFRVWVRYGFLVWAVFATSWMANSVRTQGVPESVLQDSDRVFVSEQQRLLQFNPVSPSTAPGLVFLCGSGIHPHAYAPLLRPLAEAGHAVRIVGLPWRFAPLASHKEAVIDRTLEILSADEPVGGWVVAGHSLGGALTARLAQREPPNVAHYVLVGTTHPKTNDLSGLPGPFTKVYGTHDEIAPTTRVLENRPLLPPDTSFIPIEGGNHSQFGHYGHQLLDGKANVSREVQQDATRQVLLAALASAQLQDRGPED